MIKVGYHPAWPAAFLVLGVLGLGLGLFRIAGEGFTPPLALGPLFILVAVLQFTRTYFEYDPETRTISVKALIGSMTRRFGGAKGDTLSVKNGRVHFTEPDGREKKVPVQRFMAKRAQWDAVVSQIAGTHAAH